MAIELIGIVPRHERRLRLVFSAPLAASAFGTPGPSPYLVENQDGAGYSPGVASALVVAGATTNVELALDADLVGGALYRVRAIGITAQDASVTTAASDQMFRFGVPAKVSNVEPKANDAELLFFGRDLFWTGNDYGETVEGDLATTEGLRNAQAAQTRRMLGSPLAWAPSYSPRARRFVDAPTQTVAALRADIEANALRDDRVESCTAELILDADDPTQSYFEVRPIFIGGRKVESFDVPIVF